MSGVNSCCSDLREINEAKVQNILSYLDDVHHVSSATHFNAVVNGGGGSYCGFAPHASSSSSAPFMGHNHYGGPLRSQTPIHNNEGEFQLQQQDLASSFISSPPPAPLRSMGEQQLRAVESQFNANRNAAQINHNQMMAMMKPQQHLQQQQHQFYDPLAYQSPPTPLLNQQTLAEHEQKQQQQEREEREGGGRQRGGSVLSSSPRSGGGGVARSPSPSIANVISLQHQQHPQQRRSGTGGGGAASVSSYISTSAASAALLLPLSNENSSQVYNGIKRKLDELKRSNHALTEENIDLKSQLGEFKEKEKQRICKVQGIAKTEIEGMRAEQQRLQAQHAQTMHKLLREKEQLVIKCDELTASARLLQESKASELRRLADQHAAAITEMKGKWLVQEKQRREQWMVMESKRIKDNTLKAMEPDIALLMNRHKAEKARLQEECDLIVKRKEEQMAEKEKQLQEARLKMGGDLEGLVLKEREQFRARVEEESVKYQKLIDDLKRQHEEKVQSHNKFFEEQKQHYLATIKDLEAQLLAAKAQIVEKEATLHAAVSIETNKISQAKEEAFEQRKQQLEAEVERFKQSMLSSNEEAMRRKEEEYKMIMRQERDAAIAKVVQGLEEEHIKQMSSTKEASNLIKDKMSRQDREIERLTLEKQVLEQQAQSLVQQGHMTNNTISKLQEELQALRDASLTQQETIERSFEGRLQGLDRMWQNKLTRFESQHNDEVSQLQHQHKLEVKAAQRRQEELETDIRNLESKHNAELSSINDRVVAAMSKRDATVQMLQEQLRLAQACIQERESELERHRMLLES